MINGKLDIAKENIRELKGVTLEIIQDNTHTHRERKRYIHKVLVIHGTTLGNWSLFRKSVGERKIFKGIMVEDFPN